VKTGPGKTPKGPPQNPCEGDIYINQNGWEFTFYNGKWYSSNIVLDQVIVTPNDSELARINPSLRGNNKSGYIYNKYDLKIREKLLAIRGYNSIVTFMLRMEKDGDYQPLHSLNFYKQYTKKFHSNSSIYFAAVNVPEISEIFLFANPIGAEVSVWRSGARGVISAAKTSKQAVEGVYEFTATSGKTYVGQSGNIAVRLEQHITSGKLLQGTPVKTTEVLGGKTVREIAEQLRVNSLGGIKNLENIRNPIGPNRQNLIIQNPK
jgi:hypothetical protein